MRICKILIFLLSVAIILSVASSCAVPGSKPAGTDFLTEERQVGETTGVPEETTAAVPDNLGKSGLKKDSVVLFTGDSIPDCYREDRNDPKSLGRPTGFVGKFDEYMKKNFPEDNITVLNTSFSGYRIEDIQNRFEKFISVHNPDYVILYVGTNNAWNSVDTPIETVGEHYRQLLSDILAKTGAELYVFQPYLFPSNKMFTGNTPLDEFIPRMTEISDTVCRVAAELNVPVIYSAELFDQAINRLGMRYDRDLTADGIHPTKKGYEILFDALMAEMRINGYKGKYNFDVSEIKNRYVAGK